VGETVHRHSPLNGRAGQARESSVAIPVPSGSPAVGARLLCLLRHYE
jgi:hypothetical protein